MEKLPDVLSDVQKENKIRDMRIMLKKQGVIDKDTENQQKNQQNRQKNQQKRRMFYYLKDNDSYIRLKKLLKK